MRLRAATISVPDPRRFGMALIGLLSLSSAGITSLFIEPHGVLCSTGAAAHCGWCVTTAAFAIFGAAALAAAALAERQAG